jgi:hypothetical protein
MSARRKNTSVALGLRAVRGGGVVVGVAFEEGEPRVVLSSFLATGAEGDRLSFEPYHVAAELCPDGKVSAKARAAVAEGRKRQDRLAAKGLREIADRLREERCEAVVAALLVNRAGWVTDLLAYSVAFADHPPVAEGLAVRDALRFACREADLKTAEVDEKSLPDLASEVLRIGSAGIDARLKALGAGAGRPWRKEQKLACLAAWLTLAKGT